MKKFVLSFIVSYALMLFQPSVSQTQAQSYIDTHKEWAIKAMDEFGVPASIILAVAMHESANGSSKVATYLNNHFGIKGINNNKHIKSSYKGYSSVKDSYADFIHYLKDRKQFTSLFEKYSANDYHSWAYGIMRGGYAGSQTWANHIIAIIKKHQLFTLDKGSEVSYSDGAKTELAMVEVHSLPAITYTVKKGDTLGAIAKYHKTTVKTIRTKNKLRNDRLKIGQLIKI